MKKIGLFSNLINFTNFQAYYIVTIDGKLIHKILISKIRTFNGVKVFAGDNLWPAADASYRNLLWENLPTPDFMPHLYTPTIVSLRSC